MGRSSVKRRQQKTASVSALRGFLWTFTPVICERAGLMLAVTAQSLHQSTTTAKSRQAATALCRKMKPYNNVTGCAISRTRLDRWHISSPRLIVSQTQIPGIIACIAKEGWLPRHLCAVIALLHLKHHVTFYRASRREFAAIKLIIGRVGGRDSIIYIRDVAGAAAHMKIEGVVAHFDAALVHDLDMHDHIDVACLWPRKFITSELLHRNQRGGYVIQGDRLSYLCHDARRRGCAACGCGCVA